uniref:Uncharacterized protein n=1 Tax=Caenorhabditis japonica TaxID=281687 RepID=A0A8R1E4T0_CAEJA
MPRVEKLFAKQLNIKHVHIFSTAANSYSPRQRPLFVDTQMANMDSLKRRSPVSQVVDFVRGRNRTYSVG